MENSKTSSATDLEKLQLRTFRYFWHEANQENGLVAERTAPDWPAGTAVTGLALTAYPVAVERGFVSRKDAAKRTLNTLRFFHDSRHGPEPEATGYHGLYYQLLDMHKGRRARLSGLSVIDTAILLAGALTSAAYFDREDEIEIRELADELYLKADWNWALGNGNLFRKAWKPESGFSASSHKGYDESLIIYALALGSPTYPVPASIYAEWTSSFRMISTYGYDYLYAGPLLVHQLPQIWLDLRNIRDDFMRDKGFDYFENSVRATFVHKQYAIENPGKFQGYGSKCWGLTTCDGPVTESNLGFTNRGVPFGPDDGTISAWASVCSLPFAPAIVMPLIDYYLKETDLFIGNSYGFRSAFNPGISAKSFNVHGWKSPWHVGINQGPAMLMIENFRTGLIWNMIHENQYIVKGLRKAGFEGGWIGDRPKKGRVKASSITHIL